MVTYGIGFGGSISLPIKAKKNNNQETKDLTADQEDISDEMQSLFDESLTADQEDISGERIVDIASTQFEDGRAQSSVKE